MENCDTAEGFNRKIEAYEVYFNFCLILQLVIKPLKMTYTLIYR